MKRILKRITAAVVALSMISSCSVLSTLASSASSQGLNTVTALLSVYKVLKSTGMLDLSNMTNIINIGKILTGARSLTDATPSYVDKFASGLIKGSEGLINTSNVSSVISGLQSLTGIDTSALMTASSLATSGTAPQISYSTPGVSETVSELNSIFKLLQ